MTKAELIEKRMKLMPAGQGYDFYRGWMDASRALLELVDDVQADAPTEVGQIAQNIGWNERGNMVVLPSPVQQEPSVLEVALRLRIEGYSPGKAVSEAYELIEAVRAEEARRAGK